MDRSKTGLLVALAATLAIGACGGGAAAEPPPVTDDPVVTLRNISFEPEHVTVAAGSKVTWVWDDGTLEHDVAGDGFVSGLQAQGTFEHAFDQPGTYEYFCTVHHEMEGTVTVVEAGG